MMNSSDQKELKYANPIDDALSSIRALGGSEDFLGESNITNNLL